MLRELTEKIKNTRSLNYYIKGKDNIRKFDAYFGNIKLGHITPVMVQGFLDEMMFKKCEQKYAVLKRDLTQH